MTKRARDYLLIIVVNRPIVPRKYEVRPLFEKKKKKIKKLDERMVHPGSFHAQVPAVLLFVNNLLCGLTIYF